MVQVYREAWKRAWLKTVLCYLRDSLVVYWPGKKLPRIFVNILYGFQPDFAFLVHPRNYQDIFISMPFYAPIKFFFRKEQAFALFNLTAPFVVSNFRTQNGINGIIVGQPTVPEYMAKNRHKTVRVLKKSLRLVAKISRSGAFVGLGGWYPAITRRGASLSPIADSLDLCITNGHCGTLASIVMTIQKAADLAHVPVGRLSVAIIGVGKMGLNVAKALALKVSALMLIDVNEQNLEKARLALSALNANLKLSSLNIANIDNMITVRNALSQTDLGVCATSNVRNALSLKDMPQGYLIIDDSRPEALPRDPKLNRIVLEGGLLKVPDADVNYNFGFGSGNNVFGCLGEAYVLSIDRNNELKPTLSHVDMRNFENFLAFCGRHNVCAGDFLSKDIIVSDSIVATALAKNNPAEKMS